MIWDFSNNENSMDSKHDKYSVKWLKADQNLVEKNSSRNVINSSVIRNFKEYCQGYERQELFPVSKLSNETTQHHSFNSSQYFGKNNLQSPSKILKKCKEGKSLRHIPQMLFVGNIGTMQDEDSIVQEKSEDFTEESQPFPFQINPIYCYNSKENMNNTKATEQVNKQNSSTSSSENGGIFSFLKNLGAGCSPLANRRNSDDDSAQNNNKKSSPQQPKLPIKPSESDVPSPKHDDRYGSLGKEGLQMLNKQRELEKLNKRQSKQPTKTMTPIEKQGQEQEKVNKPVDRVGKGAPLNVANTGTAKKPKSSNKDNQVQRAEQEADARSLPKDNKPKPLPVDGEEHARNAPKDKKPKTLPVDGEENTSQIPGKELPQNVSNIGTGKEIQGKDKRREKHPDMNGVEDQQTKKETTPKKEHQLKPGNDESPLEEKGKPDKLSSNLSPDAGKTERGKAFVPIQQSPQAESNALLSPAREYQSKPENDKIPLEEKGKADKLTSNLSPDATGTAKIRNAATKPIQEPSQADRTQKQQSGQPYNSTIPAEKLAENKEKVDKLAQDQPLQMPYNEATEDKKKSDRPIKPNSTVSETSGENNETNTTIPDAKHELNPTNEDGSAQKKADVEMPSNVKSAEPQQDEKQPKMEKVKKSDLSKRSERPQRKSDDMSKKDQNRQGKPAKEAGKVDKSRRDVPQPVADSGTTEGKKVKEEPVQPGSEMRKAQDQQDPTNTTTPVKKYQSPPINDDGNSQKMVGKMPSDKVEGQPSDVKVNDSQTQPKSVIDKSDLGRRPETQPQTQPKSGIDKSDLGRKPETQPKSGIDKSDLGRRPETQPKSGIDKSDLGRRPEITRKETNDASKLDEKKPEKPVKEDPTKGGLKSMSKAPPSPVSPAAIGKGIPASRKDGIIEPKRREKPVSDDEIPTPDSTESSSKNLSNNDPVEPVTHEPSAIEDKEKNEIKQGGPRKPRKVDSDNVFPYDPEIIREKLKHQIKMLREEGFYTDSEFDDMDDEIYQTVMSYGAQTNLSKMSITSESSLSLPSLSTLSFSSSSNVVKDLWTVLRKRSRTELNMIVRPVKRNKDRPLYTSGKTTTIGEAQYVDYESTAFDLNLPTKFKVSTREVESTLLMNFDPERKAMSGDKCFRLYKEPERGRQISIPINDLQIPVFVYETDNDPEGILVTDQVIRSKLQVCLEVASMYYDEISVKRGRLLVHLAEYAPNSVIGFLRQLAEAIVNRRINSKPKINGFLNKVHEMSSADRSILKKDLGDKPELDNFRLLSRLKTKVFSEFYRRVGYWELVEGEKEVSHKHLFLIRHMPRLYKTGLYPFIDFISEYIANNQIRTLDQLEVALIRFLVCSDGVITKSEFNTFCDFGLKKKC